MKRALIALVVLAGLGGAGYYVLSGRGPAKDAVATYTVAKTTFVRHVTAEGNLRAVKATSVAAPRGGGIRADEDRVARARRHAGQEGRRGRALRSVRSARSAARRPVRPRLGEREAPRGADQRRRPRSPAAKRRGSREGRARPDPAVPVQGRRDLLAQPDHRVRDRRAPREREGRSRREGQADREAPLALERRGDRGRAQQGPARDRSREHELADMQIVAPHDGILVLRRNWRGQMPKLGDQLWPGQQVAEIPLLDTMEVEVFVLEVDGSGLVEKQPAEVVVEARPDGRSPARSSSSTSSRSRARTAARPLLRGRRSRSTRPITR